MRTVIIRTLVLLMGLFSAQAQALDNWQTCPGGSSSHNMNGFVDIGRDAVVGDVIGPWFVKLRDDLVFSCTNQATPPLSATYFSNGIGTITVGSGSNVHGVWGTITHEGELYTVYRAGPNWWNTVGFILKWEFNGYMDQPQYPTSGGGTSPVVASFGQTQERQVYKTSGGLGGPPPGSPNTWRHGVWMRMVKISDTYPTAGSTLYFRAATLGLKTMRATNVMAPNGPIESATGTVSWDTQGLTRSVFWNMTFLSVNTSCTTPPLNISLGEKQIMDVPNIGADLNGYTKFYIEFLNCPQYANVFKYKLSPVPNSPNPAWGILPPIAPSTATGVGVQVAYLQNSWSGGIPNPAYPPIGPLNFNTLEVDRSGSLLGSFYIDQNHWQYPYHPYPRFNSHLWLGARMVRLNSGIYPTAGTVFAQMKVVATYK